MIDFSEFAFKDDNADNESLKRKFSDELESSTITSSNANDILSKKKIIGNRDFPIKHSKGLAELYHSNDSSPELPLILLIVGHNPSNQSWLKGHYYANPNNRMWSLLRQSGLAPSSFTCKNDKDCPGELGIGFTDLIVGIPETQSCKFSDSEVRNCSASLYKRIMDHMDRAASNCSIPTDESYPRVIAFSGVRQWKMLFPSKFDFNQSSAVTNKRSAISKFFQPVSNYSNNSNIIIKDKEDYVETNGCISNNSSNGKKKGIIQYGVQSLRPPGWPAALKDSIVFLLPSSSGAAALANEEREGPYLELSKMIRDRWKWPLMIATNHIIKSDINALHPSTSGYVVDLTNDSE